MHNRYTNTYHQLCTLHLFIHDNQMIEAIRKISGVSIASTERDPDDVVITLTRKKSSTDTIRKNSESRLLGYVYMLFKYN